MFIEGSGSPMGTDMRQKAAGSGMGGNSGLFGELAKRMQQTQGEVPVLGGMPSTSSKMPIGMPPIPGQPGMFPEMLGRGGYGAGIGASAMGDTMLGGGQRPPMTTQYGYKGGSLLGKMASNVAGQLPKDNTGSGSAW